MLWFFYPLWGSTQEHAFVLHCCNSFFFQDVCLWLTLPLFHSSYFYLLPFNHMPPHLSFLHICPPFPSFSFLFSVMTHWTCPDYGAPFICKHGIFWARGKKKMAAVWEEWEGCWAFFFQSEKKRSGKTDNKSKKRHNKRWWKIFTRGIEPFSPFCYQFWFPAHVHTEVNMLKTKERKIIMNKITTQDQHDWWWFDVKIIDAGWLIFQH